jgi:hypothetical protein
MQKVGECFSPILPGMGARILRDESSPVIGWFGATMIVLKGRLIVSGFASENEPEWSNELCLGDKKVPVKMADLVTKMAEQRPVRLARPCLELYQRGPEWDSQPTQSRVSEAAIEKSRLRRRRI